MNSAGRVLSIFDKLSAQEPRPDTSMKKVWASVFDIDQEAADYEDQVYLCLQALGSELDLVKRQLMSRGASEEMFHPGFPRYRNIASPGYVNTNWSSAREELRRPENRIPFAWAEWFLRDHGESEMDSAQLQELVAELKSIRELAQSTEMPEHIRDFVQRQIDVINGALRVYPIKGIKPLVTAIHTVNGSIDLERADIPLCQNSCRLLELEV